MFTSADRLSDSMPRRREVGAGTLVNSSFLTRFPAAVLVVITAVTISVGFGYAAVPEDKGSVHLSKHQLKTLQKTAHSADDFCLLSKYYSQESERSERKAKQHEEEADGYASRRVFEPKTGLPGGLLAHCRYFAWYYHQKAEKQKSLAAHYKNLAQSAGTRWDKSQPTKEQTSI